MPITVSRAVREHAPRNALWCRAGVRALIADSSASAVAVVADVSVPVRERRLVDGRILIRPADGWGWPNDEPDAVGELLLAAGGLGLAAVGWWSPDRAPALGPRDASGASLYLEVAGLTLWAGSHRICTEEPARIHAVLQD